MKFSTSTRYLKLRRKIAIVVPGIITLCGLASLGRAQFTQQSGKLVSSLAYGYFGSSVALSGDGNTALVGSSFFGDVLVFTHSGGVWTQQGGNLANQDNELFPGWVALSGDGNTALVGGTGNGLFTRSGGVWRPGATLAGGWVALSGDGNTALVGGGAAGTNVFTRSGGAWTQQQTLAAYAAGGLPLVALSGDGNTALVANQFDVLVFTRSGGVWIQQGGKLVGGSLYSSLALSGDGNTALVGSPSFNGGTVLVFTRSGGVWTQQGKLVGMGAAGDAQQGWSVALSGDGNTALVGGPNAGAVWVFTRSSGVWAQQGGVLVGPAGAGFFGGSVALSGDGNTALIGAPETDLSPGGYYGAAWVFTRPGACQVSVQLKYGQCDLPWGTTQYDSHVGETMCRLGCATTALAMALNTTGVLQLPGHASLDPGSLNQFMVLTGSYDSNHNVEFETTTLDISFLAAIPTTLGKSVYFDDSLTGLSSTSQSTNVATTALKGAVCDGHAVVVAVARAASTCVPNLSAVPGGHYVLVFGEHDDVNGNPHFDIVDPGCVKGSGVLPAITSLDTYQNQFQIRGFVADPANVSTLHASIDDSADLLLTDALGHRTGSDGGTLINKEIPRSSYFRDFLTDNETGQQATGITHSVNLFQPADGTYGITVTGLKVGMYTLAIARFSADGSPQPKVQIVGIAGAGSQTQFQLGFSNAASPGVTLLATFASTLADISNSLQLGLIDNHGIANSLSQKIQAARAATGPARNNILNAFKNQVNAQAGRHIAGNAPQVLLQDADSLISQNPNL